MTSRQTPHFISSPSVSRLVHCRTKINRRLAIVILVGGTWTTPSRWTAVSATEVKEYEDLAMELITGVRGVIELERTGAEERAVRRKADPQRERIKAFIQKWSVDSSINSTTSFKQITYALRELGQFYIKNGQRAPLTSEVADRVLQSLNAAELSLKPK
eukprot:g6472.t1